MTGGSARVLGSLVGTALLLLSVCAHAQEWSGIPPGTWSDWGDLLPRWIQYRLKKSADGSKPGRPIVYFQVRNASTYTFAATCSMRDERSGELILLFTERLAPGETGSPEHSGLAEEGAPSSGGCTLNIEVGQ